jgi:hypothetical protein
MKHILGNVSQTEGPLLSALLTEDAEARKGREPLATASGPSTLRPTRPCLRLHPDARHVN